MASIDERVVAMSFENTKFEASIAATMGTLNKLDQIIRNIGHTSGLDKIETNADKITLRAPMDALGKLKSKLGFDREASTAFSGLETAADKVTFAGPNTAVDKLKQKLAFPEAPAEFAALEGSSSKISFGGISRAITGIGGQFGKLQVTASLVFANIATQAISKIGGLAKSITLDPIAQGFGEYATNLNSIQTILANTQDSGGNLKTVNAALQELNKYSDQTIYNFSQMARNIGTFTAAGVRLKPATQSIKGIANLAALSGSNSEQASTAMYQLSQAIAAGKVGLQDWNSVVNAGMGGAVFQKALMRTAESMGALKKGAVEIDKATGKATINGNSFRESIASKPGQKSWLSSDVLVKTLGQFTGDLTDAQLKAQGFNDQQIAAIQKTAQTAKKAATEVKTLSGVFNVVKESIGSGWANTFQIIFGNFGESKKTFTELSNFIQGFVSRTFKAFNGVLLQWKKLGGRTELIKGIKRAFDDLMRVIKPIHDAFREIFPAKTGRDLFKTTQGFSNLMKALRPSHATMKELKRIFAGFFATMQVGWAIIKGVVGIFGNMFTSIGKGSGGFLKFSGNIGDFLVHLNRVLIKGGALNRFFERLTEVLKMPLKYIKEVASAIGSLFGSGDASGLDKFSGSMSGLNKSLNPFGKLVDIAAKAWAGFTNIMGKVKSAISPLLDEIGHVVANFGSIVANSIKNADYSVIFGAINTVLIAGIVVAIKKVLGGGLKVDVGGGLIKNLSAMFSTLTGNLKAMQRNVQAKTILAIAAALAVLAIAILVLSTVDPKKLATAMAALAVGMGELVTSMAILNKAAGGSAFVRMPFIAGSLILLAGAMILLAVAAKIFASMSWEEIGKGMAAVAGMLAGIGAATQLMNGPKLIATGIALLPIAAALILLAGAAKIFATMSWKDIAKGLAGIAGSLLGIGAALQAFPPTAALMGPSLILIGIALNIIAGAMLVFGRMDYKTLAKGIGAIAGSLVAIGLALDTMPPTLALQAAGLVILAAALTGISGVVAIFGHMDIKTLAKGIIAMGAAMLVLAVGLYAMSGTLPGSIALMAAAAAFAVLAPALALMGTMSWETIARGLGAMAAVIAVLAVAGLVAGPALVALGIGLLAIGAGVALIGAGVYLFAKGLSLLSDTAVKAFAALLAAGALFIAAFPQMVINFVKGVVTALDGIVKLAPKIISALINIFGQLLDAVIKLAPKIGEAIGALIVQILKILNDNAEPVIKAGFKLLDNLLTGLANNIGPITTHVALLVTNFLNALATKLPSIIAAGLNLLVGFLSGITKGMPRLVSTVASLIVAFVSNLTSHIPQIVEAAGTLIATFITGLANQIPKIVAAGVSIITNFLTGIQQSIPKIVDKAVALAKTFLTNLSEGLLKIVNIAADTIINFLNGLADAIRTHKEKVWKAGFNLASAIGEGMVEGLKQIAPKLIKKVKGIAGDMIGAATSVFSIGSPSRVFSDIGRNIMTGLANGLDAHAPKVTATITASAMNAVRVAKTQFAKIPDTLEHIDSSPVITPVLDLSNVKKQAPRLKDMISTSPLKVGVTSRDTASTIAIQQKALQAVPAGHGPTVNFHQNNYSPEPLSSIEIYRQTNNQISRIKRMLVTA